MLLGRPKNEGYFQVSYNIFNYFFFLHILYLIFNFYYIIISFSTLALLLSCLFIFLYCWNLLPQFSQLPFALKCSILSLSLFLSVSLGLTGSNSLHIYTIPQFSLTLLLTLNFAWFGSVRSSEREKQQKQEKSITRSVVNETRTDQFRAGQATSRASRRVWPIWPIYHMTPTI